MQHEIQSLRFCNIHGVTLGLLNTKIFIMIVILVVNVQDSQAVIGTIVSSPSTRYVFENDEGILRCQNRTVSGSESVHNNDISDAEWYRQFSNGTTHQYGTTGPVRVQSHILYIAHVKPEDQGVYFCCKPGGSHCSGNSTVIITVAPAIEAAENNYVGTIGSNVTLVCRITNPGRPKANFHWRNNGTQISNNSNSLLYENTTHFTLTLLNLTEGDASTYRCVAVTKKSTRVQTLDLYIKVPPEIKINGSTETMFGSNVTIKCTVVKGYPPPSVSIINPKGEVTDGSMITFNATMKDTGNYTCVANNSIATVTRNLSLIVNVAPRPVKSRQWVLVTTGADVVLTCVVDVAYPPPLIQWTHVAPHLDVVTGKSQPLNNGSLLLTGVKLPAIYKCIAFNEYGASVQLMYITVKNKNYNEMMMFFITDPKSNCYHHRSENFKTEISNAFEKYIQYNCNCTATITSANLICINDSSALYTVQIMHGDYLIVAFIYDLLNIVTVNGTIDLGVAVIHTWNNETRRQPVMTDDDDDEKSFDWHPILYSLLALLVVVVLIFISHMCYCRYVRNRRTASFNSDKARTDSIQSDTPLRRDSNVILANEVAVADSNKSPVEPEHNGIFLSMLSTSIQPWNNVTAV